MNIVVGCSRFGMRGWVLSYLGSLVSSFIFPKALELAFPVGPRGTLEIEGKFGSDPAPIPERTVISKKSCDISWNTLHHNLLRPLGSSYCSHARHTMRGSMTDSCHCASGTHDAGKKKKALFNLVFWEFSGFCFLTFHTCFCQVTWALCMTSSKTCTNLRVVPRIGS